MMDAQVVLCADSESVRNPGLVGLEGERLEAQDWLRVFCSAVEARSYLRSAQSIREVWVASSDEIDPINLAAALKKDSMGKEVCLLAFQGSGSLKSRANAAGLDATFSRHDFLKRYGRIKHLHQGIRQVNYTAAMEPTLQGEAASNMAEPPLASPPFTVHRSPAVPGVEGGKAAHVISVVSAAGGSGKSTVAALTALYSQCLGYQTLLLDADLQFGDMHYMLGEESPLTMDDLIEDSSKASKLKADGSRPALLAAPAQLEKSEAIARELPGLLERLKMQFEVIVVNTGAFWAEQHAALIERSSTALFLIDQRASSLRACKHALDLCTRCGIATHPFVFAINRCTRNAPLSSIDVSCALHGAHVIELQEGGREVGELLGAGIPFELIGTRNGLCLSIETMVLEVLPKKEDGKKTRISATKPKRFHFGRKRRRVACL